MSGWSEIEPGLFLCGIGEWPRDAEQDGLFVCVLDDAPDLPGITPVHVPIIDRMAQRAIVDRLDIVAQIIDDHIGKQRVIVHCGAGMERSPLAVVWWLYTKRGMSLDDAYRHVRRIRPQVQDRLAWLPATAKGTLPIGA